MKNQSLPGLPPENTGYKLNGRWVTEKEFMKDARGFGVPMVSSPSIKTWPMYSEGAGVHPDDAQKAADESRKLGVPTDFTKDGRAIFTGLRHQRAYTKAVGLHNNDDNA